MASLCVMISFVDMETDIGAQLREAKAEAEARAGALRTKIERARRLIAGYEKRLAEKARHLTAAFLNISPDPKQPKPRQRVAKFSLDSEFTTLILQMRYPVVTVPMVGDAWNLK